MYNLEAAGERESGVSLCSSVLPDSVSSYLFSVLCGTLPLTPHTPCVGEEIKKKKKAGVEKKE